MKRTARHCVYLALGFVAVLAAGCGGSGVKTYPVSGKVTFEDGSPLTKGTVVFESTTMAAMGQIQPDGTYTLTTYKDGDGAPEGSYKVYLQGDIFGSEEEAASPTEDGLEDYAEGSTETVGEALVDAKFSGPQNSGLTCDVSGSTTFDFKVQKPGA